MPLSYDPSLVLLSLALAIQGSYVCLRIALQINGSHGLKRRLLLTGAAFSLAVAIWSAAEPERPCAQMLPRPRKLAAESAR